MPGKQVDSGSYNYISGVKLLRTVNTTATDAASSAGAAACAYTIDLSQPETSNVANDKICVGAENALVVGLLFEQTGAVTVDYQIYVNMTPAGNEDIGNAGWALVDEDTGLDESTQIYLRNIYPGEVAVLITGTANIDVDNPLYVVYSRTE